MVGCTFQAVSAKGGWKGHEWLHLGIVILIPRYYLRHLLCAVKVFFFLFSHCPYQHSQYSKHWDSFSTLIEYEKQFFDVSVLTEINVYLKICHHASRFPITRGVFLHAPNVGMGIDVFVKRTWLSTAYLFHFRIVSTLPKHFERVITLVSGGPKHHRRSPMTLSMTVIVLCRSYNLYANYA